MTKILFTVIAAIILSAPWAAANTWNLTDSITGTQGTLSGAPTYSSGGFFTYNGINNYFDTGIGKNYSGSWAFTAWVRNVNGSVCGDGAAAFGRAYDYRLFTGGSCEIILNVQNATAQDNTHYNASLVFTNNTWRHVAWTYDSTTNRSVVYVDNILRSNITQRGVEQISASIPWRMGGNPSTGLYFNGSVANVTVWETNLNQANITHLYNNNTPYCGSIRNWWAFASTNVTCQTYTPPGFNLYVNITITNTTIRQVPTNLRGVHSAETLQNPAYSSGLLRNHTADLGVVDTTKIMAIRKDIDLANFCTFYTGNPLLPCSFSTSYGSNYNISAVENMVTEAASRNMKVHFVDDGPTRWGASNLSNCNYGSNTAPDFDYTSCDWHNNTIKANAYNQFMDRVGCDTHPGTCAYEGRNEPYLAAGNTLGAARGVFYYRNTSITCADRRAGVMAEWNQTFPLIKAYWGDTIEYWSPAFNVGFHVCGPVMADQFMDEHPAGDANSPDFMNDHEYSSSNPPVLNTDLAAAEALFSAGGYAGAWGITESGLNNNALNWQSQVTQQPALMASWIYGLTSTTFQRMLFFQFDGGESYTVYNMTNLSIRYPGRVLNATKFFDETRGTLKTCTTTNVNVTCAYNLVNATKAVMVLSNNQNRTVLLQTVSVTGSNVTVASSNYNGSTESIVGASVANIALPAYAINGYNFTIQGADITPPILTNRSEFSNSNTLQINVTCDEACNASINFGTNFSVLGNKSNITDFSLTNQSWNLTPLFNNTNYHYNITVCDNINNCATYGIYSEFTKNSSVNNISFTSNTPTTPTTITEGDNITFTYSLDNSYSLPTTTTWRINGTIQTSIETSLFLQTNYTSAGTLLVNVTVSAFGANTISYEWTVTVNDYNNITYNTTTPGTPVTINEPESQAFTVLLNNLGAATVTYEWLLNGTNQTSAYNSSTITFPGSYTSAGTYNITNKVYSTGGNLTYTWILTINEATPADVTATACAQAQDGINGLANYLRLIAIAVTGVIVAFGVWKFASGDFTFSTGTIVALAMALLVSGIMIVIGSIIVSGAAATCV